MMGMSAMGLLFHFVDEVLHRDSGMSYLYHTLLSQGNSTIFHSTSTNKFADKQAVCFNAYEIRLAIMRGIMN